MFHFYFPKAIKCFRSHKIFPCCLLKLQKSHLNISCQSDGGKTSRSEAWGKIHLNLLETFLFVRTFLRKEFEPNSRHCEQKEIAKASIFQENIINIFYNDSKMYTMHSFYTFYLESRMFISSKMTPILVLPLWVKLSV